LNTVKIEHDREYTKNLQGEMIENVITGNADTDYPIFGNLFL
jgi:hypothetical protein